MSSRMKWCFIALAAGCGTASAGNAYAGRFTFISIDVPGQASSQALAVNNKDEVVGFATMGPTNTYANFAWSKGTVTQAPASGSSSISMLGAINNGGWAIGLNLGGSFGWDDTGYVWRFGSRASQPVKGPAGYNFVPAGINSGNVVVGTAWTSSGGKLASYGYLAHGSRVELLSAPNLPGATEFVAINDAGLIAGAEFSGPFLGYGFIYSGGTYTSVIPPGAVGSTILFVSPAGVVGGSYYQQSSGTMGFTWDGTTYTSYTQPSSSFTEVVGIGPQGQIFGNGTAAFVVVDGRYYPITFPGAGVTATWISAVGANGTIVGFYNDANDMTHAFIATCPARHAPCTR